MNKRINTNVGILIFLMAAAILVLADFIVIGYELDYVEYNDSKESTSDDSSEKKSIVLTNQEALVIGEELYDKVSYVYVHRGMKVEENVLYRKNDDGSFSISTEFDNDNHAYEKLIISGVKDLLSEKTFNDFCSTYEIIEYNGEYYKIGGERGGDISYIETKLEVVSITESSISFNAISSYYANPDERQNPSAEINYKTNVFSLVKENNLWKVSEFTQPY